MSPMEPLPSRRHPGRPRTAPPAVNSREAGLALIQRLNGWLITGAVAGAGLLSLLAAHAFHGHTVTGDLHTSSLAGTASPSRGSNVAGAASRPQSTPSAGGALQAPAQAPAPASSAPAPVVSGGS